MTHSTAEDSAATGENRAGQKCQECGDVHTDWDKAGESAVDDGHNVGVVKAYECGRCGHTMEVPHR